MLARQSKPIGGQQQNQTVLRLAASLDRDLPTDRIQDVEPVGSAFWIAWRARVRKVFFTVDP
jgi:hypothetical protein